MDKKLFSDTLKSLYLKTNEIFEKNPSNYRFSSKRKHQYVIEDEQRMSSMEVIVPDFRINLIIIREHLAKIEEFKRMKEIINSNNNIKNRINCMIQVANYRFRYEDNDLILGRPAQKTPRRLKSLRRGLGDPHGPLGRFFGAPVGNRVSRGL